MVVSGLLLVIIIVWMFIVCSWVNFLCMLCLIMFDSLIMFSMCCFLYIISGVVLLCVICFMCLGSLVGIVLLSLCM